MKPSVIVFDFGNVLAHFHHQRAAEQLAAFSALSVETIRQRVFGSQQETDIETGEMDPAVFRQELRALIEAPHAGDADLDHGFSNMFTRNDAICDAIPHLAKRFRLLLLSNTNAIHAAHFTREYTRELGHFEKLVFSHEARSRKPDRRIYEVCQEQAACPPESILFIDDRDDNIATAHSLRWNALHYQPMHGLPDLLRQLMN